MPEIFISYAHRDNMDNPSVDYEVTTVIDHFLNIYAHEQRLTDDEREALFFKDTWAIEAGGRIPDRIREAIFQCPVMLVFYSPNYFESQMCFREWRTFREAQEYADLHDDQVPSKLLIPIEV